MLVLGHFWCICGNPIGSGLARCGNCGLIRETTPDQDRETADALARVILGGRLKTG